MSEPRKGPIFLDAAEEVATIGTRGLAGVGIQLLGTWSGTVTFEATIEGNTWVALNMVPSNSATAASTSTSNGAWTANIAGYTAVRARFSTATSGTVQAWLEGAEGAGRY